MAKETELTKQLVASLFLATYEFEKNQAPPMIRLVNKRGFHACDLVQYKFRPKEEQHDNILVVLEFFSHQRAVDLKKKVTVEIGNDTPAAQLRVIRLTQTRKDSGYSYIVQLQGNTYRNILTERA